MFKLVACGAIVVAAFAMAFGFPSSALQSEIVYASGIFSVAANVHIFGITTNTLWGESEALIREDERTNPHEWTAPQNSTQYIDHDQKVRRFVLHTRTLEIKIYALSGVTTYSTDPKQLGAVYSKGPDFTSSLNNVLGVSSGAPSRITSSTRALLNAIMVSRTR